MIDEKIKEARREYYRNYYKKNKDKIKEYQNNWRRENPDKVKEYNRQYWIKKAKGMENEAE